MNKKTPALNSPQAKALKQYAHAIANGVEWKPDEETAKALSPWQLEVLRARVLLDHAEKVTKAHETYAAAGINLASLSDPAWLEVGK